MNNLFFFLIGIQIIFICVWLSFLTFFNFSQNCPKRFTLKHFTWPWSSSIFLFLSQNSDFILINFSSKYLRSNFSLYEFWRKRGSKLQPFFHEGLSALVWDEISFFELITEFWLWFQNSYFSDFWWLEKNELKLRGTQIKVSNVAFILFHTIQTCTGYSRCHSLAGSLLKHRWPMSEKNSKNKKHFSVRQIILL